MNLAKTILILEKLQLDLSKGTNYTMFLTSFQYWGGMGNELGYTTPVLQIQGGYVKFLYSKYKIFLTPNLMKLSKFNDISPKVHLAQVLRMVISSRDF